MDIKRDYNELSSVVPWGQIAAKGWGDPCGIPILLVHGRQDNAGAFDRFIKLLPNTFYCVSVDLPGHGFSTRFPKGIALSLTLYLNALHRIIKDLKWEQFYYIGHSLGGQLGLYYAAMYPESILKLVIIDAFIPMTVKPEKYLAFHRNSQKEILEMEEKLKNTTPPCYSYDEAMRRLIESRQTEITQEAAEALMPRLLKRHEKGGYYYNLDQRLKFSITNPVSLEQFIINMTRITCPILFLLTELTNEGVNKLGYVHPEDVFKDFKNFQLLLVDGVHDIHNNSPETIVPQILQFLVKQKSML